MSKSLLLPRTAMLFQFFYLRCRSHACTTVRQNWFRKKLLTPDLLLYNKDNVMGFIFCILDILSLQYDVNKYTPHCLYVKIDNSINFNGSWFLGKCSFWGFYGTHGKYNENVYNQVAHRPYRSPVKLVQNNIDW